MKTIYLVTGANGHLGSAVCAALREKGEEVRAIVLPAGTKIKVGSQRFICVRHRERSY